MHIKIEMVNDDKVVFSKVVDTGLEKVDVDAVKHALLQSITEYGRIGLEDADGVLQFMNIPDGVVSVTVEAV